MTILKNVTVDGGGPTSDANVVQIAVGTVVLGGGGANSNVVPRFGANARPFSSIDDAGPTPTGHIMLTYNPATGDLVVTSSAGAGDAGVIVNYLLIG